ncbi:hypothetical protein C2G38_2141998 [Gigaspora rosea]|uniref:Uncharacterized protein n=1 Tax=Gigaspora rosea TaxID=44941 RepID=A0A397V8D6_9GLOM|nr:hypothetical protein C2G38_2141998 [Gigaspora rosea]
MLGQKENQYESNENINTIDETIETIDLTTNQSSDNFSFTTNTISSNLPVSNNNKIVEIEAPVTIEVPVTKTSDVFITLVCNNKFEKPNKKLDGALAIPFNPKNIKIFGNIEEKILSCNLPKQWGKIEIGRICYHTSRCLISEDGQYLKLDSDAINLWVRAIIIKMKGVDEKTPPNAPMFDKSKD